MDEKKWDAEHSNILPTLGNGKAGIQVLISTLELLPLNIFFLHSSLLNIYQAPAPWQALFTSVKTAKNLCLYLLAHVLKRKIGNKMMHNE